MSQRSLHVFSLSYNGALNLTICDYLKGWEPIEAIAT